MLSEDPQIISSPLASFERSADDAERMLRIASGLADLRVKRMRSDFKQTLGAALKVRRDQRHLLERAEGREAWVILKPNARLRRDMFGHEALEPLTRQSVVVLAAAVEAFVADCVEATLRRQLADSSMPASAIELLIKQVRDDASSDPKKIKELFRRVGVKDVLAAGSEAAGFKINSRLSRLVEMRNDVAHGAVPPGLSWDAAMSLLEDTRAVVRGLDAALGTVA